MLSGIKHSAASAARKAGLLTGGLLCMAVGAGFLTVAAWIALSLAHGALIAALVIGAVYMGLGFILFGLASARSTPQATQRHQGAQAYATSSGDAPPLVQAFLHGLQAGANAERRPS